MQDTVYSVSQLNRAAKQLLAECFGTLQVEGEISNLSSPASGHLYFSLKDKNAQVRCALFKGQRLQLGFKPSDGQQVIATAQVSLYEPRGDYQLIVDKLEAAGSGALQRAFEQLKQKLLQEGLFNPALKQTIPALPRQIGVITSASGAAIHDILTVLGRRFPAIPVILYPVSVQGESAKTEIVQALAQANQRAEVDVILLARGGGSIEDLWAFNEEIVARAIAASAIPIISGIGHEVDVTIADFVADLRAATPSAAAEHAVPDQQQWLLAFQQQEKQLQTLINRKQQHYQQQLDWLNKALQRQHPGQQLQRNAQRLDEWEQRLTQAMQRSLRHGHNRQQQADQRLQRQQPQRLISAKHQQLHSHRQRLQRAMQLKLDRLHAQHNAMKQTLHAISPLATLERGYAIVQSANGSLIKSSQQLQINDRIQTRLAQGTIESRITGIPHE
jgi:exodeoxyribonuclease VII large subunit